MEEKKKVVAMVFYGLIFSLKWLWLFTMFFLGLLYGCFFISYTFEYSYSLDELDLMEILFLIFLLLFIYRYVKLCFRVKLSLVRKIITPWVDQAHLSILCILGMVIANQLFEINIYDYVKTPLFDIITTLITMIVMVYSYFRVSFNKIKVVKNINSSDVKYSEVM